MTNEVVEATTNVAAAAACAAQTAGGKLADTVGRQAAEGQAFLKQALAWLTENGLPWDPALDADGDGFDARAEYAVGTDPLDEEDSFRIVDTGYDANGRFQVRFLGTAATSAFRVYKSDDLSRPESEWTLATGSVTRGVDGLNVWTETGDPGEARFFRIRVTLPEDARP